jgi:hypothetical protein
MRRTNGNGPWDARRFLSYAFVAGMVLAPFLASIYGWNAGLGVLCCALAATTYLVFDASRRAATDVRPQLRLLVALNGALTAVALVTLAFRLLR